jgi:two-component system phosphate regulon response regulator PhoB/two-component system alkaline phosphatase synthesis response regulator PhoP/two-component system response regulator VicR
MSTPADILIIDDDKDLVNSIEIILQTKNYQVRSAFDGKEGYGEIEKKIPDLILLDVMMATDTEGFDLAYKLKENPKYVHIPIIMITSFTQKMAEQGPESFQHILGEAWPVSSFLEKPVDPEVLLSMVEKVLSEEAGKA